MDLGDKLALGSLVINPENDSNGILVGNSVSRSGGEQTRSNYRKSDTKSLVEADTIWSSTCPKTGRLLQPKTLLQ